MFCLLFKLKGCAFNWKQVLAHVSLLSRFRRTTKKSLPPKCQKKKKESLHQHCGSNSTSASLDYFRLPAQNTILFTACHSVFSRQPKRAILIRHGNHAGFQIGNSGARETVCRWGEKSLASARISWMMESSRINEILRTLQVA